MSVHVEYCLFCDGCGANWYDGGNADIKPRERRAMARKDGWVTRRDPSGLFDYCPECPEGEETSNHA